jgi:hypothetical protein
MDMTVPTPAVLPLRAWAARYGVSKATTYRLHHNGQLTILKLGRRSVIAVADGDRLLLEAQRLPRKGGRS